MDLKSRIEASNCLIMSKQSNIESLSKNSVMKILYTKNMCFYLIFLFAPYWKSFIFMCQNIYTFWKIWSSRIFFQSFISKPENLWVIFLYAFNIKSYNFLNQIRLPNLWLIFGN